MCRAKLLSVALLLVSACATNREATAQRDLSRFDSTSMAGPGKEAQSPIASSAASAPSASPGTLGAYVRQALQHHPTLRADFERWSASVYAISKARRLPDPTLSFGYFVRSVETRVGPQIARIGVQQAIPWPGRLSASADAQAARADVLRRRMDARAIDVAARVRDLYWQLWLIRRTRAVHEEHLHVLEGLSETVLARVAVGSATLAQSQQVALASARTEDLLRALDEQERSTSAQLSAAIGGPMRSDPLPTPDEPDAPGLPLDSEQALLQAVDRHPLLDTFRLEAEAREAQAKSEEMGAYPNFSVGADWIITGESDMNPADNGKDAVFVGGGMSLPLWQGNYSDAATAARADARSQRAEGDAARDLARAELEASLSAVRDARRRVLLYTNTLVPQADAAYASVLGAFVSGRGTVADALLVQRDLLELRVDLEKARADHARGWARLERDVGRPVRAQNPKDPIAPPGGP